MRTLCYMCGAHCVTCVVCEGHMCAHCVTCAVHIVLHVLHMRIVRVTRVKCAHIVLHVRCTLCYMCGAHCVTCAVHIVLHVQSYVTRAILCGTCVTS